MYMEAHLLGDPFVNNVNNCTLARESSLTTKKRKTKEFEASFNSPAGHSAGRNPPSSQERAQMSS